MFLHAICTLLATYLATLPSVRPLLEQLCEE